MGVAIEDLEVDKSTIKSVEIKVENTEDAMAKGAALEPHNATYAARKTTYHQTSPTTRNRTIRERRTASLDRSTNTTVNYYP